MHLTSCVTLVILITSTGEFPLYFTVIFFLVSIVAGLFLGSPAFAAGIHLQWTKNSEGKQLSTG